MAAQSFKITNYITVPGFAVVELGLSGNELLCYSLIYGFTQDNETEFCGSLNYVASALNVTKPNAKGILDRLVAKGLLEKRSVVISGVKFCHFVALRGDVTETVTGLLQNDNGVTKTVTGGVTETVTVDNTITDKTNDITIDNTNGERELFATVETVATKTKSRETKRLFANSKFVDINLFMAQFTGPEFADIDLAFYYGAVADWSASKHKFSADWIATARGFIRRDIQAGKVQKVKQTSGLTPDAIQYLKDMAD